MKLRQICGVSIITLLAFSSCQQSYVDELSTQYATFSVDGKGFIGQVVDSRTGGKLSGKRGYFSYP